MKQKFFTIFSIGCVICIQSMAVSAEEPRRSQHVNIMTAQADQGGDASNDAAAENSEERKTVIDSGGNLKMVDPSTVPANKGPMIDQEGPSRPMPPGSDTRDRQQPAPLDQAR